MALTNYRALFSVQTSSATAPYDDTAWTSPQYATGLSDGGSNAIASFTNAGDYTHRILVYNLNGALNWLPSLGTINSVSVQYYVFCDSLTDPPTIEELKILDTSGQPVGNNLRTVPGVLQTNGLVMYSDGWFTAHVANTTDLGVTLTPAWVKNSAFGVSMAFRASATPSNKAYVDYVAIEIDYTPPAAVVCTGNSASQPTTSTSGAAVPFHNATANNVVQQTTSFMYATRYSRPIRDMSNTGWSPSTGSDLYATIDEMTFGDSDYVSAAVSGSIVEYRLEPLVAPGPGQDHILRYRLSAGSASQKFTFRLKQGASVLHTWTESGLTTSFESRSITLSAGVVATITDYGALSVSVEATQT